MKMFDYITGPFTDYITGPFTAIFNILFVELCILQMGVILVSGYDVI